MNYKALIVLIVVLCAAVLAICAWCEPTSFVDSIEHSARTIADIAMLMLLAYLAVRYKERGGVTRR